MQVPLQFEFQSNLSFASFFAGQNAEIVTSLRAMAGDGETHQDAYDSL